MAKRKKNKFKYMNIVWIILSLLGIVAIGYVGYVISQTQFPEFKIPSGLDPDKEFELPPSTSCSMVFSKSVACTGEDVTANINDGINRKCIIFYNYENTGWKIYNVIDTDSSGRYSETQSADTSGSYVFAALCGYFVGEAFTVECRTNDANIQIIDCEECTDTDGGDNKDQPGHITFGDDVYYDYCFDDNTVYEYYCLADDWMGHKIVCEDNEECYTTRSGGYCRDIEGYDVGDIVGEIDFNEIMVDGDDNNVWFINLDNVELGGEHRLGARIWTSWDYDTPSTCSGIMGSEGMSWAFQDSEYIKWYVTDTYPQSHYEDLCPLVWDGQTDWRLFANKLLNLPNCDLEVGGRVEVYVCE